MHSILLQAIIREHAILIYINEKNRTPCYQHKLDPRAGFELVFIADIGVNLCSQNSIGFSINFFLGPVRAKIENFNSDLRLGSLVHISILVWWNQSTPNLIVPLPLS